MTRYYIIKVSPIDRLGKITDLILYNMKKSTFGLVLLAVGLGFNIQSADAQDSAPAFPGAEGFARYITGGRGGSIIHVTTLDDSGSGSLREAVSGDSKKTIVFDVGGTIALLSDLTIGGNTTIAGQTAPDPGITLRYYTVQPGGDNIIIRFMRFRRGEELDVNDGADAFFGRHYTGMMLDHCSFSWSIDECASCYDNNDFTMQWCTVCESLNNAGHGKGAHGYGGIWGGKGASFHHTLLAHHNNRIPRLNGARYNWQGYDTLTYANSIEAERVDLRNCVMYNQGTGGAYGGPGGGYHNIVNCYYKYGPGTSSSKRTRVFQCSANNSSDSDGVIPDNVYGKFYINGNYVVAASSPAYYDWKGVVADHTAALDTIKLDEPTDPGEVTTHTAETAYEKVLLYAGASLYRDAEDTRYMYEAETQTATYTGSVTGLDGIIDVVADVGGYTALEETSRESGFDTDKDGIPDEWEVANGLNRYSKSDASSYTLDSKKFYTNLEVYMNSLVQDIMIAENEDCESGVDEYYPAYYTEDGTYVEAIYVTSGIREVYTDGANSPVTTGLYDVRGMRVDESYKGLVIEVTTTESGKTTSRKYFRK